MYKTPNDVEFIKIYAPPIEELVAHIKNLKEEIRRYYGSDELLLQEVDDFTLTLQRILGTMKNYSAFLQEIDEALIKFFTVSLRPRYRNLHETHIKPIIQLLKSLKTENNNAYITKITALVSDINKEEKISIITRQRIEKKELIIEGRSINIYRDKEFVKLGVFTDHLIFIGTPSFFDQKFSAVFFARKTYFLGYSCFENSILPSSSFENLIAKKYIINTVYKDVNLEDGYKGINYKTSIKQPLEQYDEEKIIQKIENNQNNNNNVKARLIYISNNNYTLLAIDQSITTIEREEYKIQQSQIKNLEVGDLLVFRSNNGSNLIKEVADNILGEEASELRAQQDEWKKRLRSCIKRQGIETVISVLQKKYDISYANKLNLSNWVSPLCIKPDALEKILIALRFTDYEQKEILRATKEIYAAHIKAGHKISKSLMEEINIHVEEILGEKGYYKFESKIFAGASFNIEEIKGISKRTVMVSENDILKVYKN